MVPAVPPAPVRASLRASDADRERVAEVVRSAAVEGRLDMGELDDRLGAVFAARTYDDLAATVTDLPDGASPLPLSGATAARSGSALVPRAGDPHADPHARDDAVTRRTRAVVPRVVDGPANGTSVAVFSENGRSGHWVVPEKCSAVAVVGSVKLDLCHADFAAREVVVTAFAMFGSVEIRVPEGVTVRADGIGVFGAFDSAAGFDAGVGAPVLVVRGAGVFGSVEVKRPRPGRGALGRGVRAALDRSTQDDRDRQLEVDRDRARLRDGRDTDR